MGTHMHTRSHMTTFQRTVDATTQAYRWPVSAPVPKVGSICRTNDVTSPSLVKRHERVARGKPETQGRDDNNGLEEEQLRRTIVRLSNSAMATQDTSPRVQSAKDPLGRHSKTAAFSKDENRTGGLALDLLKLAVDLYFDDRCAPKRRRKRKTIKRTRNGPFMAVAIVGHRGRPLGKHVDRKGTGL